MILAIEEPIAVLLLELLCFAVYRQIGDIHWVADAECIQLFKLEILYFGRKGGAAFRMAMRQIQACFGQYTDGLLVVNGERNAGENGLGHEDLRQTKESQEQGESEHVHRINTSVVREKRVQR